jgi:hypothetical protein
LFGRLSIPLDRREFWHPAAAVRVVGSSNVGVVDGLTLNEGIQTGRTLRGRLEGLSGSCDGEQIALTEGLFRRLTQIQAEW